MVSNFAQLGPDQQDSRGTTFSQLSNTMARLLGLWTGLLAGDRPEECVETTLVLFYL